MSRFIRILYSLDTPEDVERARAACRIAGLACASVYRLTQEQEPSFYNEYFFVESGTIEAAPRKGGEAP